MTQLAIDCATPLTTENAKALKAAGVSVVCRYLGRVTHNWWNATTPTEVKAILDEGLQLVSIWEGLSNSESYFTRERGQLDAQQAAQEARFLGQPGSTPIYFTVDFAESSPEDAAILDYIDAVTEALDGYTVGVYGDFHVIELMRAQRPQINYLWQTCAWSDGNVSAGACLYQRAVNQTLCGVSVDINDILGDCGAWPAKEVAPVTQLDPNAVRLVNALLGAAYGTTQDPAIRDVEHFMANAGRAAAGLPVLLAAHRLQSDLAKATANGLWQSYANSGKSLPSSVNNRDLYGPVLDQGPLGACSAFAATQWRTALHQQAGLAYEHLSELAQYYEERVLNGSVGTDSGATMAEAVQVLEQFGGMPEEDDKYDPSKFTNAPPSDWDAALKLDPSQALYIQHAALNDIKDALARGLPVMLAYVCFAEMESPNVAQTGVLPMPTNPSQIAGGHMVNVIGYDDSRQAFLILNQWGDTWGQQGCFWMPYAYMEQYAMDVVAGLPDNGVAPHPVTHDYKLQAAFQQDHVNVGDALTLCVKAADGTTPVAKQSLMSAWTEPKGSHDGPGITGTDGVCLFAYTQADAGNVTATTTWVDPTGKTQTATATATVKAPEPVTPPAPPTPDPAPPIPPSPPVEDWKQASMDWLKSNGLITSDHNPDASPTWAEFGVVLRNFANKQGGK